MEMCLAAGPFVSITLFASLFSSKFVLFMSFVLLGAQSSFLSVVLTERPASLKLVMRDLCPYEVLTSHRHFFPLQVPFFTSRTEVPSPESLHCRKIFFLPRNCWVGGTNSHSPFRRCSEFFFEAPPPPFVESSALLCKPTRLEVVPSCRESFFSPADGFRRPDVREPMPGRCRDYALLSFILPSSRCPFSPLPICSVSPVFSKPPPPLGFPPQVPLPPMSSPQFLKGSFGYRSSSTRLPCAVCTDYRCYYWELSSMYLWYAYFFFSRLFWGNKTVLLCRFFSICGNVAVVPKLEVRSNCTRIFVPVWRSYLWPITFIVFFSSTLIFYKNIRYEMKCTYTQSQ